MEQEQVLSEVVEPTVVFKLISDRTSMRISSAIDPTKTMVEISGYDLQIDFNFDYIKDLQDVESAAGGLADLFKDLIIQKMLKGEQP